VRVAPNELSFNTAQSWRDIYGPRKGHATFVKSKFYDGGNFANQAHSIVSERDPAKHAEMRKYLSSAFSDRSLKEQEYLVSDVIDRFIMQIERRGASPGGVDMTLWFNLMTFDVIGKLAFGKDFGGLDSGTEHFWISTVLESMGQASLGDTLARFPLLARIWMRLNPNWLKALADGSARHEGYTLDLIEKRVHQQTDRKDFMSYLLQDQAVKQLSIVQLAAHGSDFVIAGSETTATTLAVVTYFVSRHPAVLKKLQTEIRTAFTTYEQINGASAAGLRYLHAVCLEALRVFPPLSLALPRVVPPGGDTVDGVFLPGGITVATNPFASSMSATNFRDPWKFDPERWLGMNEGDVLEASQPFSIGTRGCLGRSLAWLELHTTLAKLHWKLDLAMLSNDDELDWHRDVRMHLLWKKPPLFMKSALRSDLI
jgi:cytochrome P450